MEESVDGMVLPILAEIGAALTEVKSISDFQNDDFYHAVATMLGVINKENSYKPRLPGSKAGRFRLTSQMSNEIKDMGFTGSCGYETFLYPNESDSRKLLIWLVNKLPKVSQEEEEDEVLGADALLQRSIMQGIKAFVKQSFDPADMHRTRASTWMLSSQRLALPVSEPEPARVYCATTQRPIHRQCRHQQIAPSVFEMTAVEQVKAQAQERYWEEQEGKNVTPEQKQEALNKLIAEAFRVEVGTAGHQKSGGIYGGSSGSATAGDASTAYGTTTTAFQRRAEFAQDTKESAAQVVTESGVVETVDESGEVKKEVDDEEEQQQLKEAREAKLAKANAKLRSMAEKLKKVDQAVENNNTQAREKQGQVAKVSSEVDKEHEAYLVQKRTLDLLPNAEANAKQLQAVVASSSERLIKLGAAWEGVRKPLINRYRRKKQLQRDRKSEVGMKVEQIKLMRQEMKARAHDLKEKAKLHEQALAELNKLPKSVNRVVYVQRIMDVVRNLQKQKEEIQRILESVRKVQKDINAASQTQQRSFAIADDRIYNAAKREQAQGLPPAEQFAGGSYKDIVGLRDGFAVLVNQVEQTGHCKNETMEISRRIEALEQKNTQDNMARVMEDLQQVKAENETLIAQARKLRAALRGNR